MSARQPTIHLIGIVLTGSYDWVLDRLKAPAATFLRFLQLIPRTCPDTRNILANHFVKDVEQRAGYQRRGMR